MALYWSDEASENLWKALVDKLNVISVCMKETAYRYLDGFPDVDERGAYHTGQPIESYHLLYQHCVHALCKLCMCVCDVCSL